MERFLLGLGCLGISLALCGCPQEEKPQTAPKVVDAYADDLPQIPDYEDWYPEAIDPPEGTEYPSKLTPLPLALEGLPNRDRAYINHTFALIVILARSSLATQKALGSLQQQAALESHLDLIESTLIDLQAEDVPKGMDGFHADLTAIVEFHKIYYEKVGALYDERVTTLLKNGANETAVERARETTARDAAEILEVNAASAKIAGAWNKLFLRYKGRWDNAVKESVFSHLRALDL